MVRGLAVPMPRLPPEEAQFASALPEPRSHTRVSTPEPPACSEGGGRGGLGLAAGTGDKGAEAGLHVNLCNALPVHFLEDEDQLQTAREDTANEEFYGKFSLEELTPPAGCTVSLGAALPFGVPAQGTQTCDSADFPGPPRRAGAADFLMEDFRGKPKTCATRSQVVSIGSVGHPHSCSEPCKHRMRKTGCLLGASCHKCHLCHWRSERARTAQELRQAALGVPAAAALDALARTPPPPQPREVHRPMPWEPPAPPQVPRLAPPTRRDQPAYVIPSASVGERPPSAPEAAAAAGGKGPPAAFRGSADCPSLGSIGHPLSCQWPCKYARKLKGCKQGPACDRCHLCCWTRSKEHKKQILEAKVLPLFG
ncbi:unnamed protein product [Prorocentrum cordatum]|uniref:C3H1-type domain-containing protein n=1 Tax=Prorocentrum cordatum TaxID=2364126 RepID=A0ABN9WHQ9_9DINO|nr:unnamed protein product [Polarella glacialis]